MYTFALHILSIVKWCVMRNNRWFLEWFLARLCQHLFVAKPSGYFSKNYQVRACISREDHHDAEKMFQKKNYKSIWLKFVNYYVKRKSERHITFTRNVNGNRLKKFISLPAYWIQACIHICRSNGDLPSLPWIHRRRIAPSGILVSTDGFYHFRQPVIKYFFFGNILLIH